MAVKDSAKCKHGADKSDHPACAKLKKKYECILFLFPAARNNVIKRLDKSVVKAHDQRYRTSRHAGHRIRHRHTEALYGCPYTPHKCSPIPYIYTSQPKSTVILYLRVIFFMIKRDKFYTVAKHFPHHRLFSSNSEIPPCSPSC